MKLKLGLTIFITFFKLFVSAQENVKADELKNKLAGTWIWEMTEICQRSNPTQETPLLCNCTRTLIINSDGTVKLLVNDLLKDSSHYIITEVDNRTDPVYYIFSSEILDGTITLDENKLSISSCASDGTNNEYVKAKSK